MVKRAVAEWGGKGEPCRAYRKAYSTGPGKQKDDGDQEEKGGEPSFSGFLSRKRHLCSAITKAIRTVLFSG
jgi:hypothetical protein